MKFLLRAVISIIFVALFSLALFARADDQSGYFNVRTFGATGTGMSLDTPFINKAIDECARLGGGTVYFPAGTYLSGSIHLQSNVHLLIDAGATILGASQDMHVYDETEPWTNNPYQDGGHCYFHNSLIWGVGLTNVFITGQGMISGGGLVRDDKVLDRMCGFEAWGKGDSMNNGTYPPSQLGNKAIALKLCRNVLIRDITIYHGGHFAILVTGCDNMTVDNVTMDTDRDGIDIDCCRNTMVSNCRINSPNDDGLCPKASFALGTNRPTENLTIVNCQVTGYEVGTLLDGTDKPSRVANGRFKCGTESNGGFRNITMSNCTFRDCKGMALEEVDGGIMDNIVINNIVMTDVKDYPIYITLGNRNRGPAATTGSIRNIQISNVIATDVDKRSGIQITGVPGRDIENVRLDNVRIIYNGGGTSLDAARVPKELDKAYPEAGKLGTMPSYGLFARHVTGLELANVTVGFDANDLRPAMVCTNVNGLEIDNFKGQIASGVQPAKFADVKGLVIRNSPVLQ